MNIFVRLLMLSVLSIALLWSITEPSPAGETAERRAVRHINPRTLLLSLDKLNEAKAAVAAGDRDAVIRYKDLMRRTVPFLEMKNLPSVVDNDYVAPGATKNDYVSFSTYYWPNPDTPDGFPFVKKDGQANDELLRGEKGHDHEYLKTMVQAVTTLVTAAYLGDDADCNEKAIRILRHWFLEPKTRMNPHLEYSQGVPGKNTGASSGVIDTHSFYMLIEMLGLLEACPEWTMEEREGMNRWFSAFLDWLLTSDLGRSESRSVNNHGSWYDVQIVCIAWYVKRYDFATETLKKCKSRIDTQIERDGSQPQELKRTIPFTYSVMNLRPLIILAHYAQRCNIDLWNYTGTNGGNIRMAYEFLLPFAKGEKSWPYEDLNFNPKSFDAVLRLLGDRFDADQEKRKALPNRYDFETFIR